MPTQIGEWVGTDDNTDIDDPNLANLTRKYTNRRTGRWLMVSLTAGHPGLTAVHTPEYCYRGSGYDQVGRIERRPLVNKGETAGGILDHAVRKKSAAGTEQLRVFWAGVPASGWAAPDSPRWHYLGKSSLYKLYVVGLGQDDVTPGKDPALDDFLYALIGTLDRSACSPLRHVRRDSPPNAPGGSEP